jgi:hypothetical protein
VAFYQEAGNGFYVETLVPALCLILFYFLLQQQTIASIVTALAIFSVKEDAPIAAAMAAIVAGVETWICSPGNSARHRFNSPAAITLIVSLSAIPLLLAISCAQQPTTYAHHSLDRLGMVAPGILSSPGALFVFSYPTLLIGLVVTLSVSGCGSWLSAHSERSCCARIIWLLVCPQRWSHGS